MSGHRCHAEGCELEVAPRLLFCVGHWRALPVPLQELVWAFYAPGQEVRKRVTPAYMVAQRLAVAWTAGAEGDRETAEDCIVQARALWPRLSAAKRARVRSAVAQVPELFRGNS